MHMELILSNGGILEFQPGLPEKYAGPVLRGAVAHCAKSNLTEVVVQELSGDGYWIRFSIGRFLKKVSASKWLHTKGFYSSFMLKNGAHKEIDSIGKFHLRQDQYTCFFSNSANCNATFEKNNEFRLLDVFYSPSVLKELAPYFPELNGFLNSTSPMFLNGKKGWTLPTMKEIYNQILECPYDEASRQFYFDLKVRELLYQLLEKAFKRNAAEPNFTPFEISRIHEAKTILESYIDKKPPSIRQLSRRVAINENKLKNGFKKYFSAGLFEWLMERKMQHAKQLVLTTNKPIKEISSLVGYPRTTNFITAFRRRFGMTPGSLRR